MEKSFDWTADLTPILAAQACWNGKDYNALKTIQLHYQSTGPFVIACGAGLVSTHIRTFRMTPDFIQRLGQFSDASGRSLFQESFLNYLQRMRLRVNISMPAEGTLLLPGEPLLIAHGPDIQLRILATCFRWLVWEPSYWATEAAMARQKTGLIREEDSPEEPEFGFNATGVKARALFIGGAPESDLDELASKPVRDMTDTERSMFIVNNSGDSIVQVRRLYQVDTPLGDMFLSRLEEAAASVSKTHTTLLDWETQKEVNIQMTRFVNIYQPVLTKGHSVVSATRTVYLRQRFLQQWEAFDKVNMVKYPQGWIK